jgi:hypothetical protein
MKVPHTIVSLLLGLSAPALTLHAHHSVGSSFDTSQVVTVTGVVTSLQWRNPHVTFHVDVKNVDGSISDWRMEMKGPRWTLSVGSRSGRRACRHASEGKSISG